jgi:hypothetical protein
MAFAGVVQPTTFAERCDLARRIRDELELPLPIFVDGMDDASRALFSDLPGPAFVLDRNGRIVDKQAWVDPELLTRTLALLLAHDALPSAPVPGDSATTRTLEECDAVARRLLARSEPERALAWLDAAAAAVPSNAIATARAAITRVEALRSAPIEQRGAALQTAFAAAQAAWPDDAARRVAASVALAQASLGTPDAPKAWQRALEELGATAPDAARTWLARQRDAATKH